MAPALSIFLEVLKGRTLSSTPEILIQQVWSEYIMGICVLKKWRVILMESQVGKHWDRRPQLSWERERDREELGRSQS